MASRTVTAYTFFDVAPDCSQAALRHAYDAMVARHHPDKAWSTPTAAASKTGMQEVNRWYALVATEEARAAYDRTLQQQKRQPTTQDALGPGSGSSATPARSKSRRKPVHGSVRTQQQLALARPPLLQQPVALFCALVVSAAQAVAVAGAWAQRQTAAIRRRRRALLRGARVLVVAAVAVSVLVGWPAGGPVGWWLGPCAAPARFAANRHYRQLGLADGGPATPLADIRRAYHQAIRRHHPDKQPRSPRSPPPWPAVCVGSSRRLQAIGEAYQVLRDPQTRCVYDAQQQQWWRRLWQRTPAPDCPPARWAPAWDEAPGMPTTRDAVALWHAGQVAVFQTVQSLWASVWKSVRGLAGRVVALVHRG